MLDADPRTFRLGGRHVGHELPGQRKPLVEGEQRLLVRISTDREDHLVEQLPRPGEDVEMPERDRVERTGVDRKMAAHAGILRHDRADLRHRRRPARVTARSDGTGRTEPGRNGRNHAASRCEAPI